MAMGRGPGYRGRRAVVWVTDDPAAFSLVREG
jgi:hypothetical protein